MEAPHTKSRAEKLHEQEVKSELAISKVLRYGALISTFIMAVGIILRVIRGPGSTGGIGFIHLSELLPHLLRMERDA